MGARQRARKGEVVNAANQLQVNLGEPSSVGLVLTLIILRGNIGFPDELRVKLTEGSERRTIIHIRANPVDVKRMNRWMEGTGTVMVMLNMMLATYADAFGWPEYDIQPTDVPFPNGNASATEQQPGARCS